MGGGSGGGMSRVKGSEGGHVSCRGVHEQCGRVMEGDTNVGGRWRWGRHEQWVKT